MFNELIHFIREQYQTHDAIPLHAPVFSGRERQYVNETIDSTFVSTVGSHVNRFEQDIQNYTNSSFAIATVNGTAALHIALKLAGVSSGDLVITQALTFVATCNAISYCGGEPVFVDVDPYTLGLSPVAMQNWLEEHAFIDDHDQCRTKIDHRLIRACVPMHTFGHPVDMDALLVVCEHWHLKLVEDAAESLGSLYKGRHTGTFGALGIISFNGNKIITTGGGGMILTADVSLATQAKYLTTTAKEIHPYEFIHKEVGYNYRLPNINAAIGCGQLEQIEYFIESKRELSSRYAEFFENTHLRFLKEPKDCRSNYWLNAVICEDRHERDSLLEITNKHRISTRPIWKLMTELPMHQHHRRDDLSNSNFFVNRVVNLPSSILPKDIQ